MCFKQTSTLKMVSLERCIFLSRNDALVFVFGVVPLWHPVVARVTGVEPVGWHLVLMQVSRGRRHLRLLRLSRHHHLLLLWLLPRSRRGQRLGLEGSCPDRVMLVDIPRHVLLPGVRHELSPPPVVGNVRQPHSPVGFSRLHLVGVGVVQFRVTGAVRGASGTDVTVVKSDPAAPFSADVGCMVASSSLVSRGCWSGLLPNPHLS